MVGSHTFAQEIRLGEFTKRECTFLLGKPDGEGGIRPVHGSTVQRFCRDMPPKIERLFHSGQNVPYAFRIISDELIAKIISNRSYEFIQHERQEHQFKHNGGVFEAEIIDEIPPTETARGGYTSPPGSSPSQAHEDRIIDKNQPNTQETTQRNDAETALISVDGIRTQYIEKMESLEVKIGDLNRENGELHAAKKFLEEGLNDTKEKLSELTSNNDEVLSDLNNKIHKQGGALEETQGNFLREKNKNTISTVLFVAVLSVFAIFSWYKIDTLIFTISAGEKNIISKKTEIETAQKILQEERLEHKQALNNLNASIDSWRLNSESREKEIQRLDTRLREKESELKKQVHQPASSSDTIQPPLMPEPDIH